MYSQNQYTSAALVSQYFKGNEQVLSKVLTYDNIKWEANLLNIAESVIPEKLCMDLHFDMILNQGTQAVTNYYKTLLTGKNQILEQAKLKLSSRSLKINESSAAFRKEIKKKLTTLLNEADLTADPTAFFSNQFKNIITPSAQVQTPPLEGPAAFDAAVKGGEYVGKDANKLGLLQSLWNGITEGGSPIGILHLVLDLVGIIGDFVFPGAGAIADILNACIYFYRGKMLLGSISLIAGLVFGSGDLIKLFKPVAVPMEKVLAASMKSSKLGAEELAKVSVKEQGLVIKGLRYISKNIEAVLGKASGILGKFFNEFIAKVAGWVPFIGKPLKAFFENIGSSFAKYSDDLTKFSKEFPAIEKEAIEASAKNLSQSINKVYKGEAKAELDAVTGTVKITDNSGKVIGEVAEEILIDAKLWNKKAPGLFSPGKSDDVLKYINSIASSNQKMTTGIAKYFAKTVGKTVKTSAEFAAFLGKQVIKFITGEDAQKAGYSDDEIEYWGNSALTSWVNEEIKKKKEETGATYVPAITLDSSDDETFERITNYQNTYAELTGMPSIIPVVYNKYNDEEAQEDFEEFFKQMRIESKKEVQESVQYKLKHIIPYSKF